MDNSSEKFLTFYTKNATFFLGFFVLSLVAKNFHFPFGSILFIVSTSTLAIIYVFLGTSIPRDENTAANFFKQITYYAIATGLIALLFRMQHWPDANELSLVFLTILPILLIIAFVKKINIQSELNFNEIMLLLGTALLLLRYYFV